MSFYQKIANDFGTTIGLDGGDKSLTYAKNNKLILFICQKNSQRWVSFKGFVDNFKLSVKYKFDEQESMFLKGKKKFLQKTNVEYSFTLNVPSSSEVEGQNNVGKFQEASRYLLPVLPAGKKDKIITSDNLLYVSLANLIQSGQWSVGQKLKTFEHIQQFGAPCYMEKINFKPAMDLGFYDTTAEGKIIPKAFSIDFQLLVAPQKIDSGMFLVKPFALDGEYSSGTALDSKYWPFGVTDEEVNL